MAIGYNFIVKILPVVTQCINYTKLKVILKNKSLYATYSFSRRRLVFSAALIYTTNTLPNSIYLHKYL